MKQQADQTYILEFHKDDKKYDPKGSIFLDSAIEVQKVPKRGKNTFEVQMQNKNLYLFAAETESELEEWVKILKRVILSNDGVNSPAHREISRMTGTTQMRSHQLSELSVNPEIWKYVRETDSILTQQRKDGRQNLFAVYPDLQGSSDIINMINAHLNDASVYTEKFGTRFIVRCDDFKLRLQANLNEYGSPEKLFNPEPFFISMALYDVKAGEKISEDFLFDPNTEQILGMMQEEEPERNGPVDPTSSPELRAHGLDPKWLAFPKLAVYSVTRPHSDIYLVARIEKVLVGSVSQGTEPYMRTPDTKTGTKLHKVMRGYCQKLGRYRQPFAWAARQVFKPFSGELDTYSDFALYRSEASKLTEEEMIKQLLDLKKPEKQGKWQAILGSLKITVYPFKRILDNTLTSSYLPVIPFQDPPSFNNPPVLEVEEFVLESADCAYPHTTFNNHLYIYPRNLKYDSQKNFTKARNITCVVEVRDSDDEGAKALKVIYSKRSPNSTYSGSANAAILHHNTTPDFYEEIKAGMPTEISERHHIVFTFYHVSCELAKSLISAKRSSKSMQSVESIVGYAWFPLLIDGRPNVGEQNIRVATSLPPGYLTAGAAARGGVATDIKWVEGGKTLFKFSLRLVSTINTKDQHLFNFFQHCERMPPPNSKPPPLSTPSKLQSQLSAISGESKTPPGTPQNTYDKDMLKLVKSLHAVEISTQIQFMPTLLNQLFRLVTRSTNEDVAVHTVRLLVHMASAISEQRNPKTSHRHAKVETDNKDDILATYVKYVFVTEPAASSKDRTVHEELAKHLKATLRPTQADHLVLLKFLGHSWFFFEILLKSMAQHLLFTGRIKMARNERFPSSFTFHIQNLVQTIVSHIAQKYNECLIETKKANRCLANFVQKCFSFMDRGFVFRLINMYIDTLRPVDSKALHEYKFEFLQIVCGYEHYIPLCLPLTRKQVKNYKELKHEYTLSEEFRRNHFLVGLLLQEVQQSLKEIPDIRRYAILTLRNLLAKHSLDDRYGNKAQQARIAALYLPFLTLILENKNRLVVKDSLTTPQTEEPNELPSRYSVHLEHSTSQMSLDSASLSSAASVSSMGARTVHVRDPSVFALISGQPDGMASNSTLTAIDGVLPHHGSQSSLQSSESSLSSSTEKGDAGSIRSPVPFHHNRTLSIGGVSSSIMSSMSQQTMVVRHERFNVREVKDILTSFLYILKNLSDEVLLGWFKNAPEYDLLDFFDVLDICLQQFKYLGRKRIASLYMIGDTRRATTLPAKNRLSSSLGPGHGRVNSAYGDMSGQEQTTESQNRAAMEANLSSEVSLVVLDVICLFMNNFRDQMALHEGDNLKMQKIFDLFMIFLANNQAEAVKKHAFGALRAFVNKFSKALFHGEATMCGRLCYEVLRCCNSRLKTTRSEACALMYLMMRKNFEFTQQKSFTRVHLQMIVSVSQLISDVVVLSNSRFNESLSIINSYATGDKAMQKTVFPAEVKDLTKRIRTVLMATFQMKEHQNDPEKLVDLQYSLAKSYTSTPELRKTWLDSMARIHGKNGDYSEAAHCYMHITALVAEYLKRRGDFPTGCSAFRSISPNVETEEKGQQDFYGMQDVAYSEEHLTELLEKCAQLFEKAERYELLGEIYRLIIPIYERKRDFKSLSGAYQILHRAYEKVVDVTQSGKRLLGKYFRVAFYGHQFDDEDGKEFVYKEPKVTGLPEVCERLQRISQEKYGQENVKLISDSNKVDPDELNPKFAHVQVTHVTPYFDEDELKERQTDFERNNNIRRFMFETPFTKNGKARGSIEEQFKRRTILTSSHTFPYVKKRNLVVHTKEEILTPIEVAIDEMKRRVDELKQVVNIQSPDKKRLQLKLQGSVSVQVNAGPLAYAEAFLTDEKIVKYNREKIYALKDLYREFAQICNEALETNSKLIGPDQIEYHDSMRTNFIEMVEKLQDIFGEQLLDDDDRSSVHSHRSSLVMNTTAGSSSV